jgi:hypothetical protein
LPTSTLAGLCVTLPWHLAHAARRKAQSATPQTAPAPDLLARPPQIDLIDVTMETFLPHLDTRFRFWLDLQPFFTAVLAEVNAFTPPEDGTLETASQDAFALVFRGSHRAPLLQETYTLTHAALGTFLLLVVPVGLVRQQPYYEAVLNRLRCDAPAPPPLPTPRLRRRRTRNTAVRSHGG